MTKETERERLRPHLAEYVNRITTPDTGAGRNMYRCPLCGSGSHNRRSSDGAFSITPDGLKWHCFACNQGGDLFDLIGLVENLPAHGEQLRRASELFGGPGPAGRVQDGHGGTAPAASERPAASTAGKAPKAGQYREYIERCAAAAGQTDYFTRRGFTPATVARFRLGYDAGKQYIVMPYDEKGSYYMTRSTEGKNFRKPRADDAGEEPVFNAAALYSGKPCFICEGPLDAISIAQAGGEAAAVGGTGSGKLERLIKTARPKGTVILCFDNDRAGEEATSKAAEALQAEKVPFTVAVFSLDKYGAGDLKDANDLLRANGQQLREDVRQNIKAAQRKAAFIPYRVSDYLRGGAFDADISYFKNYKDRKTGFSNIDQYLTLYPGLAALGGSASLGKSTFAVNLADNLIEAGETVLYFALEQEPIELVTKSLARRLFERDPITKICNLDIKNGARSAELDAVRLEYAASAERFIIVRCNFTTTAEDIRAYVEAWIRENRTRPAVFIDYLQLISPPADFRGDVRAATDHVVKVFKTMQVDNELFVLLISNFNRNSYAVPVSYEAFKESGMIEFTCDYVWGLQLAVLDDDKFYSVKGERGAEKETSLKVRRDRIFAASEQNPKDVEFVSLKSRNGKQCYKCFFKYYMAFDAFVPAGGDGSGAGGVDDLDLVDVTDGQLSINGFPVF